MEKAIFLDKDGTLVDNSQYPREIPKDELLEKDILSGLRYLQNKRYKLFILSNQPWIAKKKMSEREAIEIFESVVAKLGKKGIKIDDYLYCPHQTSDNCECKKPKPFLVFRAAEKYNLDLNQSYIIGDMDLDILTGKNSNMKSILVLTGRGKEFKDIVQADYVINNLNEISKIL